MNGIVFSRFGAAEATAASGTNLNGIVFNEILPDPNGPNNFDTDGDGAFEATDEFLELFNTTGSAVDASGWVLTDASGNTFTLPAMTTIPADGYLVIVTNWDPGMAPTGYVSMGRGSGFFNNGPEALSLTDGISTIGMTYNMGVSIVGAGCNTDFGDDIDGLSIQAAPDGSTNFINTDTPTPLASNSCFLTGTRILTNKGYVKVEELKIGDSAISQNGDLHPIKWIGYQKVKVDSCTHAAKHYPVMLAAHALGPKLPARDLFLSPDHALHLDNLLINAGTLVNGHTIKSMKPEEDFVYFHVELESHQVIIAENLEVESLLHNAASRLIYDNGEEYLELYPQEAALVHLPMPKARISAAYKLPDSIKSLIGVSSKKTEVA